MAILIECPKCRKRNSLKKVECGCGKNIRKASSKNYWIEYYVGGKRKRERIGQSKQAAENRLREVQTAKVEGRHIKSNKNNLITLGQLKNWYLNLPEVQQKRSYRDICQCIETILKFLGENRLVGDELNQDVERFQNYRLSNKSRRGKPASPATINRNVANFRAMLNKAVDYRKIDSPPLRRLKKLEENNVREKILSEEDFGKLLSNCSGDLKGFVLIGYYIPMRQAEILNLMWDEIDFKHKFIRLGGKRTKNKKGRVIRLHPNVYDYLRRLPQPIGGGYVFKSRCFNRRAFNKAKEEAGLIDFTFHDLRHCSINNLRLAGNDHFVIKEQSGHKTNSAFERYNLVSEDEVKKLKWHPYRPLSSGKMDTYMDTKSNQQK